MTKSIVFLWWQSCEFFSISTLQCHMTLWKLF